MTDCLAGKVAVITGGASGMGLASVEAFLAEGAKVVFCDLPAEADEDLKRRLGDAGASLHHRGRAKGGAADGDVIAERLGKDAVFVPADVSDGAQVKKVVDTAVERFGGLDILFNNAGVASAEGSLTEALEAIFDRLIAVNLKAVWLGIKHAAPHLRARGGGSIISTASIAALGGICGLPAYSASKSAVLGLTRSAASEFGPDNIRVNCICPGTIITSIAQSIFGNEFDLDDQRSRINAAPIQPIPRAGEVGDIAGTALWLASDDSAFVTGQIIAVDGGASTHSWLNNSADNQRASSAPPRGSR